MDSNMIFNFLESIWIWFIGEMTDPFLSLLIFFVVDISIGILCAVKTKKFEFEELVFGIIKNM